MYISPYQRTLPRLALSLLLILVSLLIATSAFAESSSALGSIGDQIWHDYDGDGNGILDGDDEPIEGVTVILTYPDGTTVSQVTDANGFYLFEDLPTGDYVVTVDTSTLPPEKQVNLTYDPDGGDDSMSAVTLTDTDLNNIDQDFAYQALGSIGDQIWHDYDGDGNGVLDGDDEPLEGVTVILTLPDGTTQTTVTDANGNYLFEDLPFGDYTVTVDTTTLPEGKQDNPVYDADGGNDNTSTTTLDETNPDDLDQDFAYQGLGSIGDQIWHDYDGDGNGILDGDDEPLAGVTVILTLPDGTTQTTVTDPNGNYLFEDLPYGDYTVTVDTTTLPEGKQDNPVYDADGGNDNTSAVIIDETNPDNLDQDFAYQGLGSIGDQIWHDYDADGNGVIDGDDEPIEGVTVILTLPDGTTQTTVTDANGNYLFEDLPYGDYTVTVDTSTLPPEKQVNNVYDPDGGLDNTAEVTLDETTPDDLDQDFAYQALGSIGDQIWVDPDEDGDGVLNGDDTPLEGVTVILTLPDGTTQTTVTDANGNYLFEDLPFGDYTVTVDTSTLPQEVFGTPVYDPDGVLDSTSEVTLDATNPDDLDQDFAYPEMVENAISLASSSTASEHVMLPSLVIMVTLLLAVTFLATRKKLV